MELELLEFYNKFTGCGNYLTAPFWFIGLEPGGNTQDCLSNVDEFETKILNYDIKIDNNKGKGEYYYKKLKTLINDLGLGNYEDEKNNIFFDKNDPNIFITNLFPLNFKGTNTYVNEEYKKVFKSIPDSKKEYYNYLLENGQRWKVLLSNSKCRYIFILGKTDCFNHFKKAMKENSILLNELHNDSIEIKYLSKSNTINIYEMSYDKTIVEIFNESAPKVIVLPHISRWSDIFLNDINLNAINKLKVMINENTSGH